MAKLNANAVIRARIDEDTKELLERAARAEGLSLSAWMRLHLIRIAEEVLARRRQIIYMMASLVEPKSGAPHRLCANTR
jgi:uncharacterized protein (DUF1778 family)